MAILWRVASVQSCHYAKNGVPVHVLYEDICGIPQLFAASFPLAPLIALIIILIDIRVDSRRMLWMYRRPVAAIAQDIGR